MSEGGGPRFRAECGQALPAVIGLALAGLLAAVALVAIGAGATAKGRAQRAVDLAALSAARAMREELPRLFAPPQRGDGSPNPRHLERAAYLDRAQVVARRAARRNGLAPGSIEVRFPDGDSLAPLSVTVRARPVVELDGAAGHLTARTRVAATAVVEPPAKPAAAPSAATPSGGGYAGPLAHRQGTPMRPDVAVAFDRLTRAAAAAGHALAISSGFRSDAEQARLFAANPDPRWVAPPGRSLHRCATELDLGPPSAYGWLEANASRFGFLRRYSWEPWHFGFTAGPEPCSAAGDSPGLDRGRSGGWRGGDGRGAARTLPSYVPAAYRGALNDAAARSGVPAALLAAQLLVESNFNPAAVSPAGAQGIAQFMPQTAVAYGLRDPFDPEQAIAAQARLMAELLDRFGSTELALAAYNAGPGAVASCDCIPPYAETRAYVARIMALLDGTGALPAAPPPLLVRLVA